MCMWGALGLRAVSSSASPWLLKLINLIPWKARYSVTTLCAAAHARQRRDDAPGARLLVPSARAAVAPSSPVEEFYAEHFDNAYMEHRFQTMTITPEDSARAQS